MNVLKKWLSALLLVVFMVTNYSSLALATEMTLDEANAEIVEVVESDVLNESEIINSDDMYDDTFVEEDIIIEEEGEEIPSVDNNEELLENEGMEIPEDTTEEIIEDVSENPVENMDEEVDVSDEILEPLPEGTNDEPVEEVEMSETDDVVSEDLDLEVELSWSLFSKGIYETKSNKVPAWSNKGSDKTYSNSYKKRTIASKGTVVKIVKTELNKSWNYWCKTDKGDWIYSENLKSHSHSGASPQKTTTYRKSTNTLHYPIVKTAAKICTKCKNAGMSSSDYTMDKASTSEQWWNLSGHDWNSVGKCKSSGCGHTYDYSIKSTSGEYLVTTGVTLRSAPYSAASAKRTVSKGTLININAYTKNCFGNKWYRTTSNGGGWVYESNVTKHSHSYSSSTGFCSCGAEFNDYNISNMSDTAYELKSNAPVKSRPFSGASTSRNVSKGDVVTINGKAQSNPNSFLVFGKTYWFRVKGGGWINEDYLKLHNKHNCSAGKCTNNGCNYEFPLSIKYYDTAKVFETTKANVAVRVKPYSNTQTVQTIATKGTIVKIKGYAKNEPGNKWYYTSDNRWVYEDNVKEHKNHSVRAGECTNPGCGYLVNVKTKTFAATKYVTTKSTVTLRSKPFSDAPVVATCNKKNTLYSINCSTTNLSKTWHRTTDGNWISADDIGLHCHGYTNGVCTVCGADAPYQVTNLNATIFETKADNVEVWSKPYSKTQKKRVIASSGTKLVVIAQAINYYENKWYKLSDGSWVYSGNVKLSKGSEVKKSNVATVSTYILTVKNTSNKPVANASVTYAGITYTTNNNGVAEMIYATGKDALTIKATNYIDYVDNAYSMDKSRRAEITMSESGSYKAIKVLVTHNGETKDVLKSSKTLNQAVTNMHNFTMECIVGDPDTIGKYELRQGNTYYTSTDGKFSGLNANSFTAKKTISLITYDKNGIKRATQNLLINIVNQKGAAIPPTVGFNGKGIDIKLGGGVPDFLQGLQLNIQLPVDLPVTTNISDETVQVAVNMYDSKAKPEKFWKEVKELKGSSFSKFYDAHKKKDVNKKQEKDNPLIPRIKVGGYLEYAFDGTSELSGKIFVEFSWGKSQDFQIYGGVPPVVGEWTVKGKITPSGQIVISEWSKISGSIDASASLTLGIAAGLGYANTASIMAYGSGTLKTSLEIIPDFEMKKLSASAALGAKVKLLGKELLNYQIWESRDLVMVEDGVWVLEYDEEMGVYDAIEFVAMDRSYLDNRSEWNSTGEQPELLETEISEGEGDDLEVGVEISDYNFSVLQSSTYTDIRPQVVSADGTIMMVYVDDNETRESADRTMLVYSLYNTDSGTWSVPKPLHDDSTADFGFDVVSTGEQIYVVWQNAKESLQDDYSITDVGVRTEISIASYDPIIDEFVNIETITDNSSYEVMPRVAAIDDNVIVTWLSNSENDPFAATGTNKICYAYKTETEYAPMPDYGVDESVISDTDEELEEPVDESVPDDFISEEIEEEEKVITSWTMVELPEEQPWITSLAVGYLDTIGCIAFTTDEDGNSMTIDDQNVVVIDTTTNSFENYTDKAMNVEFTQIHGDNAMTWFNQGYIYYTLDLESAPQMIYTDAAIPADEYHIISDVSGNMAILYSPKGENNSNANVILYDDDTFEWGLPISVTEQTDYIQNFNGAYYDGMIVSVFNQTAVDTDTWVETNNLCTAVIGERHDLIVSHVEFADINLVAGEEKDLLIEVTNNGTVRTTKLQLTIYDDDEIVSEKTLDTTIKSGDTATLETTIKLPDEIVANTYKVCVEEIDVQDTRISDNYYDFAMGKASLNISAVASPTEDENIVVITVENKGFEKSSGSIVLYDDKGNIVTSLLDNFEPIGHGESVDCALSIGDEYFSDASSIALVVGVIPSVEQDSNAYCTTSVMVNQLASNTDTNVHVESVNLEDATVDGLSLLESSEKSITATVYNDTDEDINEGMLYAVAYDSRGIYLDTYSQSVTIGCKESIEFTATFNSEYPIQRIKIMIMKNGTLIPIIDTTVVELIEDYEEEIIIDDSSVYDIITDEEEY